MKKLLYLGLSVFCFSSLLFAQEKVDMPVWNVGDKWVFNNKGIIEVVSEDETTYTVRFSEDICIVERQGFDTIIFDKSSLHRKYSLWENVLREDYTLGRKLMFNYPYFVGKKWKEAYSSIPLVGNVSKSQTVDYYGNYKVLGWENVEVKAGKFKAIKIELSGGHKATGNLPDFQVTHYYWYSPDVQYFVKCKYDPIAQSFFPEIVDWELTSFEVKN